jgi:hypothetical protein
MMIVEQSVEWIIVKGKRNTQRKTYPSATLSITNSTWVAPGSNPGRLSYGRACSWGLSWGQPVTSVHNKRVATMMNWRTTTGSFHLKRDKFRGPWWPHGHLTSGTSSCLVQSGRVHSGPSLIPQPRAARSCDWRCVKLDENAQFLWIPCGFSVTAKLWPADTRAGTFCKTTFTFI